MRDKIYKILNHVYGILMFVSFFAGLVPIIPFIIAVIIGGDTGEAISVFLYKNYYPIIIAITTIAVMIGWIASYIREKEKLNPEKQ